MRTTRIYSCQRYGPSIYSYQMRTDRAFTPFNWGRVEHLLLSTGKSNLFRRFEHFTLIKWWRVEHLLFPKIRVEHLLLLNEDGPSVSSFWRSKYQFTLCFPHLKDKGVRRQKLYVAWNISGVQENTSFWNIWWHKQVDTFDKPQVDKTQPSHNM